MHRVLFALPMIFLFATASTELAAEPKSPTGGTPLCKDQCVKSCMGNDTPTERSNCLKRENCDDRPACPDKPKLDVQKGGAMQPKTGLPKMKSE
jgi:hypothetical protein